MIYLDTSFLVPLYLSETTSEAVETFLLTAAENFMVSRWAKVEFASTLARNVRMKVQAEASVKPIMQSFDRDMEATYYVYTPSAEDFALAATLLLEAPTLGLRGADALHLAAARNQQLTLYTLDKPLLRAAAALEVPASDAGIGAL